MSASIPSASTALPDAAWAEISVIIITLNEEQNLPLCLDTVQGAGEIVIVDSGSTDGTRAVAERYGARWLERPWTGFAPQRVYGEQHATGRYVLFLDADERLSPELHEEIAQAVKCGEAAPLLLSFHRRSEFLGREILYGDWQNDWVARLCPRGAGEWRGLEPHPWLTHRADFPLQERRCKAPLRHRPYRDISVFRAKIESYARTGAHAIWQQKGNFKANFRTFFWFFEAAFRAFWRGFRGYVLRGGMRDGRAGWHIAVQNARMVWLKYLFLSCLARRGKLE